MEVVHTVHTGAILQCAKIMVRRASAEVKYCLRMQVDYKLLEREVKEKLARKTNSLFFFSLKFLQSNEMCF